MHKQRRMKILDFTQVFLGVSAMIGDRGIDLSAYGRKERHQGAEAVPLDANLARTFRQFRHGLQSVLNISDAGIAIIRLIKTKPVLPVSLRRDIKINAWLLTPEQIRRNRYEALLCQFVACLADIGVDTEQFLENNDSCGRQDLWSCDIRVKRAILAFYSDAVSHLCSPQTTFSRAPADFVRIGGGCFRAGNV